MQLASPHSLLNRVATLGRLHYRPSFDARIRQANRRLLAAILISLAAVGASFFIEILTEVETGLVLLAAVLIVGWFADLRSALVAVAITSSSFVFLVFEPTLHDELIVDVGRLGMYVVIATALAALTNRISVLNEERTGMIERVGRANDELVRANELKDEFIGLVSHELHTPLTIIHGNAEALARYSERLDEDARRTALVDIAAESSRLGDIVNDLLTLARLDRGMALAREPVLVQGVIARAVESHCRRYPVREIRTEIPEERLVVTAVPVYLEQVLRNLLTNAEKFSPPEAAIDVRVRAGQHQLMVAVADRGPGVPAGEREAIFTPFYRSSSTAKLTSGFGVGLAVCQRMVESQGGSIWIDERRGGGAEFWFSIPVAGAIDEM